MVAETETLRHRAWEAAAAVPDPELPALTIADLGILRDVRIDNGTVEVSITPTYLGCPATAAIAREVEQALAGAGIGPVRIKTVLTPAWSSDWLSEETRRKLAAHGIAPPTSNAAPPALFASERVACPRCGSAATERISPFGSTPCKALWRCRACAEPFERFKCH